MLCFFFPVLFALILEEFGTDWSSGVVTPWTRLPRDVWGLHPWKWSNMVLSYLLQLPLLWARGSGETIPRGAFQPHPSLILWKTGKDFKKSPERQRRSQWLLFRVSFHVFPPSPLQQEQEQSQLCVSVALCHTHLCHSQNSWGARSEQ